VFTAIFKVSFAPPNTVVCHALFRSVKSLPTVSLFFLHEIDAINKTIESKENEKMVLFFIAGKFTDY